MNTEVRDVLNYVLEPPVQSEVVTAETETNTSYDDMTTAGPSIAGVTLEAGQSVLVIVSARMANSGANETLMAFAVSGAETDAGDDDDAARVVGTTETMATRATVYTAGTAGSHTFTAKYRVTGGTGTIRFRRIIVKPF